MGEEEKPKKRGRPPGGAKKPPEEKNKGIGSGRQSGSKNKVQGKIVGAHKQLGRDNRHLNSYQGQTRKEFLRVRDGESQEEWEKRTAKRTIYGRSSDSIIKGTKQGKLVVTSRKLPGMQKEVQLRIYRKLNERMFDFLRVYTLIMEWASVRHDVLKDDIEIGYYFYQGIPFTKQEFNQYCMMGGYVKQVFARFYKRGYIQKMSIMAQNGKIKDTQYYVLSAEFTRLITTVYGVLTKTMKFQTENSHQKPQPTRELMDWIVKANEDIEETLNGLKKQEKIQFRNED